MSCTPFIQSIQWCVAWSLGTSEASRRLWLADHCEPSQPSWPFLPLLLYLPFLRKGLVISVSVPDHNLTWVLDLSSFAKAPSQEKHWNLQPLPCGSARPFFRSCFIFPLELSMPCFPLHIKGWKSRWWTRSLSTRVSCQVSVADFISSYKHFIASMVFTGRI